MKSADVLRGIFLLSVLIFCTADINDSQRLPTEVKTGSCQNLNMLMAHNSSRGVQIVLRSSLSTGNKIMQLSNHYLPPECGTNYYRCNILHFQRSGLSYYIIPLIGGFMALYHSANNADISSTEELEKLFVPVTETLRCNPIKTFSAGDNNILYIACMDLQTRPKGSLYYLSYDFFQSRLSVITNSEMIYDPETVSEVIFIRGSEQTCSESNNLYFIDDKYALRFPASSFDPHFISSTNELQNCTEYPENLEYYGNDSLIIRCSNGQTAIYDSCRTGLFSYPQRDRIPYPCTSWNNTIAYLSGRRLTLNGITQQLPFDDLMYGKCVQGLKYPTFIGSSSDGSIFIVPFNGNRSNLVQLTDGNCFNDSMTCPRPVLSMNEQVLGVFDSVTSTLTIVNLTKGCRVHPTIENVLIPDLMVITNGQGNYNCSCFEVDIGDEMSTFHEMSVPNVRIVISVVVVIAAVITAAVLAVAGIWCWRRSSNSAKLIQESTRTVRRDEIIELSEQNEANANMDNESVEMKSSIEDETVDQQRTENKVNNSNTIEANNNGVHEEEIDDVITQVALDERCPHHHSSACMNMNRELDVSRNHRHTSTNREGTSFPVTITATQVSVTNEPGNHNIVPTVRPSALLAESHRGDLCAYIYDGSSANSQVVNVIPVLETGSGDQSSTMPNNYTEHSIDLDESQYPDNDRSR